MDTFYGKSVYDGIAIGRLKFWKKNKNEIKQYCVIEPKAEYARFQSALKEAIIQLDILKQKATDEVGEENAEIFEIHKLMLEDTDYLDSIENVILNQGFNAEYAVSVTCKNFAEMFSSMDDSYMQARAIDIKDISDRLINILMSNKVNSVSYDEPAILVAEDFTPSETLQFDKSKILAFVTSKGSLNSHTAILARTMNIPAIIGLDLISKEELNGKFAVVDGFVGAVFIEPNDVLLETSYKRLDEEKEKTKDSNILSAF